MYYKLNPDIALRRWKYVPYAYYKKGVREAQKLNKEQFDTLIQCDGLTELPDTPLVHQLIQQNFIIPVTKGDLSSTWSLFKESQTRYFPALYLVITGKCNYNCLHCFMAADNAPKMTELSYETCLNILDECVKCGIQTIVITGGEPFVHPHFMDILKACQQRHLTVQDINTNGSFITKDILNQMLEINILPRMKISFDGLKHHDWMRNIKGAEKRTIQAIQLCHDMGFPVEVQTNVHLDNLDTLLETAAFFDQMGIEEMRIIRTTEAPRWVHNANGKCLDLEDYYQKMTHFASQYVAQKRQMQIDIWQFLTLFPKQKVYRYRPISLTGQSYRSNYPVCAGNRGMVTITSSGEVVPCAQMSGYYEKNQMSLGNIYETTLESLLTDSPYLDKITCPISKVQEHDSSCKACPYWKLCAGGCRAIALALTHDELARDPAKCLFFHHNWMDKIDHAILIANHDYQNIDTIDGKPVRESIHKQEGQ